MRAGLARALCLALLPVSCAGFYVREEPLPVRPAVSEPSAPTALSVSEAAELAVRNAVSLRASREALKAREAAFGLGLRDFLPRVRLTAEAGDDVAAFGPDAASRSLGIGLSQVLWDGGRRGAARAIERMELDLARDALDLEEQSLAEAAIAAYRASQAAEARLGIRRDSLSLAEAERALLAKERELGLATEADIVEADLSLAAMGLAVTEAELSAELAESELAEALGLDELPILGEALPTTRLAVDVDEAVLLPLALRRSRELAVARASLGRRRAEARLAAFSWLPILSLEASGRVHGDRLPLGDAEWMLSLELSMDSAPISGSLSGGAGTGSEGSRRTRSSVGLEPLGRLSSAPKPGEAAVAAALEEERYRLLASRLERDFRAAALSYRSAARLLAVKDDALALGEERLRIATLGARLGKATRSEKVEAELRRAGLQVDVVDALLAMIAAERRLESLLRIPPSSLAAFVERL